jgi:integrase
MHAIFNCAERWELVDKNPISLVRVRGGSRRAHRPLIVTVEQFDAILAQLKEPYRTMGLIAGGLGLRISEIVGLQWADFDFEASTLLVQRTVMHGRVGPVKTEYSEDYVPLDPLLAAALLQYREQLWYPTKEGWVFASPRTARPYHQDTIQQKHIRKAGASIGLPFELGWHTFRHSYRSWLDESGTPISVQKELMRHASIQTTMNVYGRAMAETKRQANSNVVRMILPSRTADQKPSDKRQKVACGG